MVKRPTIPESLFRQILYESGHRRSVPSCGSRDNLEIAHIVSWSKVRVHTAENLIALCPSCHASFDDIRRGGRKARAAVENLSKYKERNRLLTAPPISLQPPIPVPLASTPPAPRFPFVVENGTFSSLGSKIGRYRIYSNGIAVAESGFDIAEVATKSYLEVRFPIGFDEVLTLDFEGPHETKILRQDGYGVTLYLPGRQTTGEFQWRVSGLWRVGMMD